jgi:hypothetical protein
VAEHCKFRPPTKPATPPPTKPVTQPAQPTFGVSELFLTMEAHLREFGVSKADAWAEELLTQALRNKETKSEVLGFMDKRPFFQFFLFMIIE